MDMSHVDELVRRWFIELPRVQPFYSVHCNADPVLLRMLSNHADVGFFCNTRETLETAADFVAAENIFYANAFWTRGAVTQAKNHNVGLVAFDSERDLGRICSVYPEAE